MKQNKKKPQQTEYCLTLGLWIENFEVFLTINEIMAIQ